MTDAGKNYFLNHGLTIMMVGFFIFFAGFIALVMAGRYSNPLIHTVAMSAAITGFALYVIGRISVFIHNKKKRQESNSL